MSSALLRSALYLPANRASAIAKAREADCDGVILDLEDAVAPEHKAQARSAAFAAVAQGGFGERTLVIRANAADTPWHGDDMAALATSGVDAVLLPKVGSAADLGDARARLPASIALWAMLETCAAFLALPQLAKAAREHRVGAFVIGTNDLALEMRCKPDANRSPLVPLLSQAVVAARAASVAVLDGVFNDLSDEAGLAAEAQQGASLGFDGKTVIHPSQLPTVNAAFGPSAAAIEAARGITSAFEAPENAGKGVIRHEGRMVELLHLEQARRTLAQARAIARRGND